MVRPLAARQQDLARESILEAAIASLVETPGQDISMRALAKASGVSERTIFRYFASRDELLDEVAKEYSRRLNQPAAPSSVPELLSYVPAVYARFEDNATLTRAALRSEIYHRVRKKEELSRGAAIVSLIDKAAPKRSRVERQIASTNIRYFVIASTWNYYRFNFGLSFDETLQCAMTAIGQSIAGLGVKLPEA